MLCVVSVSSNTRGGIGHHLDNLAHQSTGIQHRLAKGHAIAAALVDQDAVREGVGIDTDQFADQHLLIDQRRRVEQLAQAHVLLGQRRQFLQTALQEQRLGLELLVLREQFAAAADLAGHAFPGAHRQVGQPVEGREYQAQLTTHWLEGVEARIHHHQDDRKHRQDKQADTQGRSFGK